MNLIKPLSAYVPRTLILLLCTALVCRYLFSLAPEQLNVVVYKVALVFLGGFIGYWLDRAIFPYARPDGYLVDFWQRGTDESLGSVDHEVCQGYHTVYALTMLRRAFIIVATIITMGVGL